MQQHALEYTRLGGGVFKFGESYRFAEFDGAILRSFDPVCEARRQIVIRVSAEKYVAPETWR